MPGVLERLRTPLADRYTVDSEIGRGGMAVVFRAEGLKHPLDVAGDGVREIALFRDTPERVADLKADLPTQP